MSTLLEKNTGSFDWNTMVNRLCPNMVPQSKSKGSILFALARQELGKGDAKCPGSHKTIWNDITNDDISIPVNEPQKYHCLITDKLILVLNGIF
mmetsp:Transcript_8127/g.17652  ORF Transcript_8127/g.17652 Transcript_8127/m.17652 type:complete len:94 (-) Transcript_8127:9-290(-)